MKTQIVRIGNSQGIRIPKTILEQCNFASEVDLLVNDNNIVLKPVKSNPRKNWEKAFKQMHQIQDDKLLIPDNIDLDWDEY